MKLSLIVAMDLERGIGKNNDLMWHLPADMRFFKETTQGHVVVMGRKNYESIPERFRPLPGRENVVLTRNTDYKAEGCEIFHDIQDCLAAYQDENERTVFIIGGGEIYRQSMQSEFLTEMIITHVDHKYGADTFFPEFKEEEWEVETVFLHEKDEKNAAEFRVVRYSKKAK